MTSDDERTQILQMVSAGTITPEQAGDLLGALDEVDNMQDPPSGASYRANSTPRRTFRFTPAEIVELRMHGITADYVRELQDLGLTDLPFKSLIEFGMHGVTPRFIHEMQDAGYRDLTTQDLIELGMHGVDADYIKEMREAGYGHLSIKQLIEFRMHGVDANYMREMEAVGVYGEGSRDR